jgi:hypothetical protein
MMRAFAGAAFLLVSGVAGAATTPIGTDFGVRTVGGPKVLTPIVQEKSSESPAALTGAQSTGPTPLSGVARIGAQWGRVTSMKRSVEHNRRVGGVRNSYHLSGRAIDIARRPGVSHAQIAASLRAAGYRLIESLDEGDHSHFAFGFGLGQRLQNAAAIAAKSGEVTTWHMVYAPSGSGR